MQLFTKYHNLGEDELDGGHVLLPKKCSNEPKNKLKVLIYFQDPESISNIKDRLR